MATLFQTLQFLDGNGDPITEGTVEWYEAGTSTPKDTWIDQAESATAANPVVLDTAGYPDHGSGRAAIWLRGSYKMVLKNNAGTTLLTLDNINEYDQLDWTSLTATIADLNSTTTTALLKTGTYTIVAGDRGKTILADTTSGAFTINLPAAATAGNKFKIIIKKIDNTVNAVTIDGASSETIDDRLTYLLNDYFDFVELHSDGSNWHVVASQIRGTVTAVSAVTTLTLSNNTHLMKADASGGAFAVNLPSAVTVGRGWKVTVKKVDSSTNIVTVTPSGAETIDGAASTGISIQYFSITFVSDGTNWLIASEYGDNASGGTYPIRQLTGFLCEQDSGDTEHDVKFNVGSARGENNLANMTLASAMIKRTDASWAEGTGNGGFPTGITLAVSTWYHCFVISKPDGTTDAGFDSDIDATNLLADATGYTDYKRVWSIYTDTSGNITDSYMTVLPGGLRETHFKELIIDVNDTLVASTAKTVTLTRVPPDVKTYATFNLSWTNTNSAALLYIYSSDQDDQVPDESGTVLDVEPLFTNIMTQDPEHAGGRYKILTGTAKDIKIISDYNVSGFWISIIGWEE